MTSPRRIVLKAGWFLAAAAVFAALFVLAVRPWQRTWGASKAEAGRPMPGDGLVTAADFETTRAVTIKVPPEKVWPWLVQMGFRRGGLYRYDWIDRRLGLLDAPSANRILPAFQDLKQGMKIPLGKGPAWVVTVMQAPNSLVFDIRRPGIRISWSWLLSPAADGKTRLVLRIRNKKEALPASSSMMTALDRGEFVMVRRMLSGIKRRAEGNPLPPAAELAELGLWAAAAIAGFVALIAAFLRKRWKRPFIAAWAAFVCVFILAFRQPSLLGGAALVGALLYGLVLSLRKPRERRRIKPAASREA